MGRAAAWPRLCRQERYLHASFSTDRPRQSPAVGPLLESCCLSGNGRSIGSISPQAYAEVPEAVPSHPPQLPRANAALTLVLASAAAFFLEGGRGMGGRPPIHPLGYVPDRDRSTCILRSRNPARPLETALVSPGPLGRNNNGTLTPTPPTHRPRGSKSPRQPVLAPRPKESLLNQPGRLRDK